MIDSLAFIFLIFLTINICFDLLYFDSIVIYSFTSIIVYSNTELDKLNIFSDNKGKAGIYPWTRIVSENFYIGSAIDLSTRLQRYYFFFFTI
jgi:hypothetical protein